MLFLCACIPLAGAIDTKPQWRVIHEPMFSLIYEANIHSHAQRVATQLNYYLNQHLNEMPLTRAMKPIPIVLYTRAHTSNGNVGLMPYRSLWFNKPAPFAQLEWFDALAVHEGRHIVQYNQMGDNFVAKAMSFALGELGSGAFSALFLPAWFFEGDAVVSETLMTEGGRGRTASFDLWYRTDLLEHAPYSYDRAMLGTGFDRTPRHSPYVLGRYLTAYLRSEYGSDLFDRVINRLATASGFNLDSALKKETGLTLNEHYERMVSTLQGYWQHQLSTLGVSTVDLIKGQQGEHWQSFYPINVVDQQVFAVKVDAKLGSSIVVIEEGRDRLIQPLTNRAARSYYGGSKTMSVVAHNDQWCWIEEKPHAKKPFQETADLYCWSQDEGEQQLSAGERFTYVGSNHQQFLVNRFSEDRSSEFVLLDKKGGLLKVVSLPSNSIAYDIRPVQDGWVYVLSGGESDGVYHIDRELENTTLLKPNSHETLRSPILTEHWLLYSSDVSGIDQVYARSRASDKTYQVATRPYGSYFLHWDKVNQRIVMADYTAQGQQIVAVEFKDLPKAPSHWKQVVEQPRSAPIFMEALEQHLPITEVDFSNVSFESKPYTPVRHLWNPHSWNLFFDGDQLSASIFSDDVMDKVNVQLTSGYDASAEDWFGSINAQYRSDAGPYYRSRIEKTINENDQVVSNVSILAQQPIENYFGVYQSTWQPYLGIERQALNQGDSLTRLVYGTRYQRTKERAFQAIETPSGFEQSINGQFYLTEQTINWLSSSKLTLEGFNEKQSVDFALSLQHLNTPISMLSQQRIFSSTDQLGYSAQMEANYRINLGAVGRSFTPLLYWRNTEVNLSLLSQQVGESNELAFGLGVAPNINALRNTNIKLKPSLSLYFQPNSGAVSLEYQIQLGGF
ncbi:hypothetical protein KO489_09765 [Reinekea forsetii]|nr:hypothetical protein [Reinekea forsetii]